MDTSKTYIKMCKKAEEIQDNRPVMEEQDFFYHNVCLYCYSIENYAPNPMYMHTCSACGYKGVQHKDLGFVWLPRQDQLQEMVGDFDESFAVLGFIETYDQFTLPEYIKSWEQLWLAFVMKEKYDKIWIGEDWGKR